QRAADLERIRIDVARGQIHRRAVGDGLIDELGVRLERVVDAAGRDGERIVVDVRRVDAAGPREADPRTIAVLDRDELTVLGVVGAVAGREPQRDVVAARVGAGVGLARSDEAGARDPAGRADGGERERAHHSLPATTSWTIPGSIAGVIDTRSLSRFGAPVS